MAATSGPSTGPGGGPTGFCAELVAVEPLVELPPSDAKSAAHDALLQLLGQGDVLALMRREAIEGPTMDPSTISAVRLEPWAAWPPTIHPPVNVVANSAAVPFVSGIEPTGTFALGISPFPANAPPGCNLQAIYSITPDAPPGPGALTVQLDGKCDDFPVSVATAGDGTHFVANDVPVVDKNGSPARGIVLHVLSTDGTTIKTPTHICASGRLVGDVLSTEKGFVFVQSGTADFDCGSTGVARQLYVRRFEGGSEVAFVAVDGNDDMVYARILPRSGGSWLIHRESGASAEVQPPGMAIRVGAEGPVGEPFPISDAGERRLAAAAALGGGFVVAIVDSLGPSAPTVTLRVYSAEGALTAQTSFPTNDAWLSGDRVTLVGSPDGTSVLIGWTNISGGAAAAMFVRRFDCVNAL